MAMTTYLPSFAGAEEIADEWANEYSALRADWDAASAARDAVNAEYQAAYQRVSSADPSHRLTAQLHLYQLELPLLEAEYPLLERMATFAPKAQAANRKAVEIADAMLTLARETVRQRFHADYPANVWNVPDNLLSPYVEMHPVVHAMRNRYADVANRAHTPVVSGDLRTAALLMAPKIDSLRERIAATTKAIAAERAERAAQAKQREAEDAAHRKAEAQRAAHAVEIAAEARKRLNLTEAAPSKAKRGEKV
jgi:hypothetical protein